MAALGRFLGKDAAAGAMLLAMMGAASAMGVPERPAPASGATDLVSLSTRADQLDKVVGFLRDGTQRCLSAQGRLIERLSTRGFDLRKGDPALGSKVVWNKAHAMEALGDRADDLRHELDADTAIETAGTMLSEGGLPEARKDELLGHLGVRLACLQWADRSLGMIAEGLAKGPTAQVIERMRDVREMALRDDARVRAFATMGADLDREAIQAMESFGRTP